MNCRQLAAKIEELQPHAAPQDVARLCLLLTTAVEDAGDLEDPDVLQASWRAAGLRLQLATDQHAAMTAELEDLACSNPAQFDPAQIWVLLRAIKVQSQILQLYLGGPPLDV